MLMSKRKQKKVTRFSSGNNHINRTFFLITNRRNSGKFIQHSVYTMNDQSSPHPAQQCYSRGNWAKCLSSSWGPISPVGHSHHHARDVGISNAITALRISHSSQQLHDQDVRIHSTVGSKHGPSTANTLKVAVHELSLSFSESKHQACLTHPTKQLRSRANWSCTTMAFTDYRVNLLASLGEAIKAKY